MQCLQTIYTSLVDILINAINLGESDDILIILGHLVVLVQAIVLVSIVIFGILIILVLFVVVLLLSHLAILGLGLRFLGLIGSRFWLGLISGILYLVLCI